MNPRHGGASRGKTGIEDHWCTEDEAYRLPCNMFNNCGPFAMCVPGGALLPRPDCPKDAPFCWCGPDVGCYTRFCTVGDDASCNWNDDIQCVAYHHPGQAPPGLEDLGICMRANVGPCAGKFGIDCVL